MQYSVETLTDPQRITGSFPEYWFILSATWQTNLITHNDRSQLEQYLQYNLLWKVSDDKSLTILNKLYNKSSWDTYGISYIILN